MCVAAKGWLLGRAATLLLLLIDIFIFNGIRELTSFGCGLAFPFSSLSLCSKNFMFYRIVGCLVGLLVKRSSINPVAASTIFS